MGQFVENVERDVLSTAGGGDTSHEGGAYEQALASAVTAPAPSPSATATGTAPVGTGSAATGPRKIDSKEVAPVDLFEVAGAPVTKRLIPIGIGALVLFVLWRLIRRGE
jgi:hypothetical protein